MEFVLKSKTDFSPKEDTDFIEKLQSSGMRIDCDLEEMMEKYPHLRERFRYESKKRGEYSPSRFISNSFNSDYSSDSYQMEPSEERHPRTNQKDKDIDIEKYNISKTNINPDSIFDDPSWRKKRIFIMNIMDSAVFVSKGNKDSGSFKIENFVHLSSVPEDFFDYHGFRDCFYGKKPSLIFISEEEYRKRKDIIFRRQEQERLRKEEIVRRAEARGSHSGRRSDGSGDARYASYSNENAEGQLVEGVYMFGDNGSSLYDNDDSRNPSLSESIEVTNDRGMGLSDIVSMARGMEEKGDDGLISGASLNNLLNSMI